MDQNSFFKWVWRFNALALALVLLGFIAAVTLPFPLWLVRPAIERVIEPPPPAPKSPTYRWTLQSSHEGGSDGVLALEIPALPYDPLSGPRSEWPPKTINYLFVDTTTGATRWLFPTHKQVITAANYVTDKSVRARLLDVQTGPLHPPMQGNPTAIVFDVVASEPADFDFANPGTYQLYASKLDGSALTKLMTDLDDAPRLIPIGTERIFVSAQSKGKPIVASFALTDFKQIAQTDLTELTPK